MCEVQIKGFKSLRDVRLKLEDIQILVGENNAGKSNVLEALDKFFTPSKVPLGK
jgi:AAA15 family ATPase/GTPase